MVEIIWHGHACFELRGENVTVVTDPFGGMVGLPIPKAEADLVLCSHGHGDHDHHKPVKAKDGVVEKEFVGEKTFKGIPVKGIATFHDEEKGGKRGTNSIYVFMIDGISFCHVGDLGHDLSSEEIKQIGEIDVIFIPVGGFFTIGPDVATSIVSKLNPKVVFPMHYKAPGMASIFDALSTVDDYISGKENIKTIGASSTTITKEDLPKETTTIVLSL